MLMICKEPQTPFTTPFMLTLVTKKDLAEFNAISRGCVPLSIIPLGFNARSSH